MYIRLVGPAGFIQASVKVMTVRTTAFVPRLIGGLLIVMLAVAGMSCNKDEELTVTGRPVIEFDVADGVYTVKPGCELRIVPMVTNGADATYEWTMDGRVVSRERILSYTWEEKGTYYVTLTVTNAAGSVSEEARVEVVDATPPTISLAMDADGTLTVVKGAVCELRPRFQHSDMEGFEVRWLVDGVEEGRGEAFAFSRNATGRYRVVIEASNVDGKSQLEVTMVVVDSLPQKLRFEPVSYFTESTTRYTFAGRGVCLKPVAENIAADVTWRWSVDGLPADCHEQMMKFTPQSPGMYTVTVAAGDAEASVTVVCVDVTEQQRMRAATGASSAYVDKVYEYVPAPGQFIGDDSSAGGMPVSVRTHEAAKDWAKSRLDAGLFVSLGAWGGYVVAGFDHSVAAGAGEYDIAIYGNAIETSNEPGIVWVMQDVNGNGLPDDEWYELKGSDYAAPGTRRDYAVTYYRAGGSGMSVEWIDCDGTRGLVDYIYTHHKQADYYPAWIEPSSYTLRGTRLEAKSVRNDVTGQWSNPAYGWGYADNCGSDQLAVGSAADGSGQRVGLKVANAVMADGSAVELLYVDFVKVQSGVMSQCGVLGEVSTEVCRMADYTMMK